MYLSQGKCMPELTMPEQESTEFDYLLQVSTFYSQKINAFRGLWDRKYAANFQNSNSNRSFKGLLRFENFGNLSFCSMIYLPFKFEFYFCN